MAVNTSLQIGTQIVPGRIIQSLHVDLDRKHVIIHYLTGKRLIVPLDASMSPADIDTLLDKLLTDICVIQEAGCYPQTASACELGFTQT